MTVTTGLFQIDPWMTGTEDLDALAVGTAELGLDPAGAPWVSLRLRMPSSDDSDWTGGRWLRVDLVERRREPRVRHPGRTPARCAGARTPTTTLVEDVTGKPATTVAAWARANAAAFRG